MTIDKSKTQQAYEYWKQYHWMVSLRQAARKFDISHVSLIHYKVKVEGNYSSKTKRKLTNNTKQDVKMFHGMRCYVCWKTFEADKLDIDHWNGDPTNDELGNLVPLCYSCHNMKTNHNAIRRTVRFGYKKPIPHIEEMDEETTQITKL